MIDTTDMMHRLHMDPIHPIRSSVRHERSVVIAGGAVPYAVDVCARDDTVGLGPIGSGETKMDMEYGEKLSFVVGYWSLSRNRNHSLMVAHMGSHACSMSQVASRLSASGATSVYKVGSLRA
jgi:hypothetical protein